jgi:hypothetical protein
LHGCAGVASLATASQRGAVVVETGIKRGLLGFRRYRRDLDGALYILFAPSSIRVRPFGTPFQPAARHLKVGQLDPPLPPSILPTARFAYRVPAPSIQMVQVLGDLLQFAIDIVAGDKHRVDLVPSEALGGFEPV